MITLRKNVWPLLGTAVLIVSAVSVFAASMGTPTYKQSLANNGYPTTLQDLDRWYAPVPDAENAALVYLRALPPAKEDEEGYEVQDEELDARYDLDLLPMVGNAELPPPEEPIPAEMEATIREYLALHQETMDLLYTGAQLDQARYPINWDDVGAAVDHLHPLRQAERMLYVDALRYVLDENSAAATDALVAMVQVADSLSKEPLALSQLVLNGFARMVMSAIEEVLSRIELTPEQLQELRRALNRESFTTVRPMQRAFAGEAALIPGGDEMLLLAYSGEARSDFVTMPYWALFTSLRTVGTSVFRDLADAGTVRRSLDLGNLPAPELAQLLISESDVDSVQEVIMSFSPEGSIAIRAAFSRFFAWSGMAGSFYGNSLTTMALTDLAQAALAVELYQHAENDLPNTLDTLVPDYLPAVPIDPFSGDPIHYRPTDDGYLLYSVSHNGTDDGGIPNAEGKGYWDGDLLFEVRTIDR